MSLCPLPSVSLSDGSLCCVELDFCPALSEFGSLTGWQRIAADIMAGMDVSDPGPEGDAASQSATDNPKALQPEQLLRLNTVKTLAG
eukprot:scaffold276826_cov17-Prasinocladus_malaysianus.AAC.1